MIVFAVFQICAVWRVLPQRCNGCGDNVWCLKLLTPSTRPQNIRTRDVNTAKGLVTLDPTRILMAMQEATCLLTGSSHGVSELLGPTIMELLAPAPVLLHYCSASP